MDKLLYTIIGRDVTSRAADASDESSVDLDDVTAVCGLTKLQLQQMVVQNKQRKDVLFCDMGKFSFICSL